MESFKSTIMSLRQRVKPGISKRTDFQLEPDKAALLIIDIQTYLSSSSTGEKSYLYDEAIPRTIQNLNTLTEVFRCIRDRKREESTDCFDSNGCEVIFTYLQSLTNDGRDISLDYKLSGPYLTNIPKVNASLDDLFLEECFPDIPSPESNSKGDILIPKTSCSVFRSTNIDYVLRNLGTEQLVITGQLTDQCVESAVRDAADSGYFVTVVEDACAAQSVECHEKGLHGMKGFCRVLKTDEVVKELAAHSEKEQCSKAKCGTTEIEEQHPSKRRKQYHGHELKASSTKKV